MSWLWWALGALGLTGGGIGVAALLGGGPVVLLFASKAAKALWAWLKHRSFWQLVCMALCVVIVVEYAELAHARKDAAAYAKQRDELSEKLQQISDKRDQQKVVTGENIKIVTRTIHDADGRAKVIEQAPLPGNCSTPKEILDADI